MRLIFDIETNGLLDELDTIHCIEVYDIETGKQYAFNDHQGVDSKPLINGLTMLQEADELIGHNIICFDIHAIQKVYPKWYPKGTVTDTLTISKLIWTNLWLIDHTQNQRRLGKKEFGRHSLGVWGKRLKQYKDTFGETTDWQYWTQEMQDYCRKDVLVNLKLWEKIEKENYSDRAIRLECDFQTIMSRQERNGIDFNVEQAKKLVAELREESVKFFNEIQKVIPPRIEKQIFIPKATNKRYGYVKGVPITKEKEIVFNPKSRVQIVQYFKKKYLWEPIEFTDKGNPKIGSDVLSSLPYPEAKVLANYLECEKLLGQLIDGDQAWLKVVKDNGKIYGSINTNGARTGRCTHSKPNLAQVPRVGNYKGVECRALFTAPKDMVMVGCDASGLELRNLAHYLFIYDEGRYTKIILEKDIHTQNQKDAGLSTRDNAKTFIYAFNYGAGDEKIGSIVDPTANKINKRRHGAKLRAQFLRNNSAIARLIKQVKYVHRTRGYFNGLDGRKLQSISEHSALNTLLQGAGAIIMKEATVLTWKYIKEAGLYDKVFPVLNVHDENQVVTYPEYADQVGELMVKAIQDAGKNFQYKCPLDGEYKVGNNWSETH